MRTYHNKLKIFYTCFLNILFCAYEVHAQHPLGYCVDAICSEPISYGVTVQRYVAQDRFFLNFDRGTEVKIYVNNVGEKSQYFGVEINGRRGYVPKGMVRETRALRSATVPLQTDFFVLSTALNQASSHFISTTPQQPPIVLHATPIVSDPGLFITPTVSDPGLPVSPMVADTQSPISPTVADTQSPISPTISDTQLPISPMVADTQWSVSQSTSLPPQTPNIPGIENVPLSTITSNNWNQNDPSLSQFGGQPVHQSQSMFPSPDAQRQRNTEFGNSIDHQSNLVNPPFASDVHHTFSVSPGINPEPMVLNSHHQGRVSNPQIMHSSPDVLATSHLETSISPSESLMSNMQPSPSQFMQTNPSSFHDEHSFSGKSHLGPSSGVNSQFHSLNTMDAQSSALSMGASPLAQTQHSPSSISSTVDISSRLPSEIQDPDEYTRSLLREQGFLNERLADTSSSIAAPQETMKADPMLPNPIETVSNMIEPTSTVAPSVDGSLESEQSNLKKAEHVSEDLHSTAEELNAKKEHSALASDTEEALDDEEDESENEEDGENDEEEDEESEGDDIEESAPETQSEESTFSPSTAVDSSEKTSEEDPSVDSSSLEKPPSMSDTSATAELSNDGQINEVTNITDDGSNPDLNTSIDAAETTKLNESNEHSENVRTPRSLDSVSSNSGDSSSDSLHVQDLKNTSVPDHVTEPSQFEGVDEFTNSPMGMDYSAKPTRSILQDDDSPNTSEIGSKDSDLSNNEMFHQDEAAYSKSTADEDMSSTAYETLSNFVVALRASLDQLISLCPEPLYSYLMGLNVFGISSRALVFTTLMSVPCLFLFLSAIFLKESSKEHTFIVKLTEAEHQLYLSSTERNLLREEVATLNEKITELEQSLEVERNLITTLESELQDYKQANQSASIQQKENLSSIQSLEKRVDDYEQKISDLKRLINEEREKTEETLTKLQVEENANDDLNVENENLKEEIDHLNSEKDALVVQEDLYKEKVSQLEAYCNELRQEVDYHSGRATELSDQTSSYLAAMEELEKNVSTKDNEIEALRSSLSNLEVLQKMKASGDADDKNIEDRLTALLDISAIQNRLTKTENEKESLLEKLKEKTKDCDEMKVDLLELKSEIETLKMHKERAVEDRNQAQSELSVLEKYFKDKEVQLQMELGTQLTVRHQKEMDVSQAQRHILQLEEENASYKSQVSTLKLEIEETERNLKKQITGKEESAHKNWVAARTAERKAEEAKQEVAQFRQRITMLERERESWSNSAQSDIILKPVAQRISDSLHDISQGSNISGEFKSELMMPRLPPPMMSMMPPPPLSVHGPPPPFMPPFHPMIPPPPPRPPPWHLMQDKNLDFDRRNTPSDFESSSSSRRHHTPPDFESSRRHHTPPDFESSRRHHTPPDFESSRRHHTPPDLESSRRRYTPPDFDPYGSSRMPHTPPFYGREGEKRPSSPVEGSSHSRSSSPLPDFHNVPPPVSRRRDAPPPMHTRYPGPPPLGMPRRDSDFVPSRSGKMEDKGNGSFRRESQNTSRERDY